MTISDDNRRPPSSDLSPERTDDFLKVLLAEKLRLKRSARRLGLAASEADDLVQDTLESALRHQSRFVPGTSMRSFLKRIMMNLFIDNLRRARALPLEELPPEAEAAPETQPVPIWENLTATDVEKALASLAPAVATVYRMRFLEGLNYDEISARLHIPVGTVSTRLFRARARMRQVLSQADLNPAKTRDRK